MELTTEEVQKLVSQLWQDYLVLTREMAKFIEENESEMFFSLMEQREGIQASLDRYNDRTFITSLEGRNLVTTITQLNQKIMYNLHYQRNIAKRQEEVSSAYDGGINPYGTGGRMDWRR